MSAEHDPKTIAEYIMTLAQETDGKTEFVPIDLLSKTEQYVYRDLRTAIAFQFYQLSLRKRDVIQRTGRGRYIRIGGKPIMSGTSGRRVMEF